MRVTPPGAVPNASLAVSSMRLLLLEDNPTDALLVEAALEEVPGASFSLAHVETLEDAAKALGREAFDVALVDLNLPDGQGLGNFQRVQDLAPAMPVIVLTGLSDQETALAAIQRGASDYLIKDATDAPVLERSIRYAIERKKHESARLELELARIKRAEAEAANSAKDDFLATISHELRTPLNAIMGWTSLLRSGQLDEATQSEALSIIERNARSQAQLIEDLLDVSRIVAGNFRLETIDLDLASVVKSAADSVAPAAQAKNIALDLNLASASGVCGDPMRLQQVAWNLMTNAIKFSPEGGTIHVRTARTERDGDAFACLEVSDEGPGIAPEFLPYVFERFRQADGSTTRRYGGLGLGLAIVKNVVELHGGHVSVHSPGLGQGATFRAEVPILSTQEECAALAGEVRRDLAGLKVLCVDDQLESREWLRLTLSRHGAQVRTVPSVARGREVLEEWLPDVLLCDIGMPNEDGYSLLSFIQQRRLGIKCIALTGFASPGERDHALDAGFADFLAKPVTSTTLFAALQNLVL